MKARRPEIDFSEAQACWLPEAAAFAHIQNGASAQLPYLEPYLIKVLTQARARLVASHPALAREIEVFCQQEANHARTHAAYNRVLREQYSGVEAFEAEIAADFDGFLRDRSLEWNLAYCDGFESMGLVAGELFNTRFMQRVLEGADPAVRDLWEWHLAEEIEHRNVCFDVLKAISPGWKTRIDGYLYARRHLTDHSHRMKQHLLAQDEAAGRLPAPTLRSRLRGLVLGLRMAAFSLPRLLWVLAPWYGPARRRASPAVQQALQRYDARPATR